MSEAATNRKVGVLFVVIGTPPLRYSPENKVLPHLVVDNSDFSPSGLTSHSDSPYDKETIPATHFKSEDRYGPSSIRVPACGLHPPFSDAALASWLVPSSAFLLTRRDQAHDAPSSAQEAIEFVKLP